MIKGDKLGIFLIVSLLSVSMVVALYIEENSSVSFGHVLRIKNISVADMSPGKTGFLKINLKNNAKYSVTDVRAKLMLPLQIQLIDDVNEIRIAEIKDGEVKEIEYKIIASPNAPEGIYETNLIVDYVSHYGINAINYGEKKQDNYSFGIIVKSEPSVFMILENNEIYKGNYIGEVSFKFVNNGTSNIKFLTVNLLESPDYEIISDSKNYIGDLDSDDFQTANFKIKVNSKKTYIDMPVVISYRDFMNNLYTQEIKGVLKIRDESEVKKSNKSYLWIILILILGVGITYYFYKKVIKKSKKRI